MRPLPNFQELARQEAIEYQLEQKIERFEREQSDIIMRNIKSSLDFMHFLGDVSNLYFPVFLDTVLGVSADLSKNNPFPYDDEEEDFEEFDEPDSPIAPDQGAVKRSEEEPPGSQGPTDI